MRSISSVPKITALVVVSVLTLAACGSNGSDEGAPAQTTVPETTTTTVPPGTSLVAHATGPSLTAVDAPGSDVEVATLPNPRPIGESAEVDLVLLVEEEGPDGWLHVYLPIRPNGSTGWVQESDVDLVRVPYKLEVHLSEFRLALYENDEVIRESAVGLGRPDEPTPPGQYFITELLQPPDPNGVYGPYAYGLSGFSDVHFDFGGGPGQLGLHGTNDPSSIGGQSSAGCIRLPNDVIMDLVERLPLGTPVEILA